MLCWHGIVGAWRGKGREADRSRRRLNGRKKVGEDGESHQRIKQNQAATNLVGEAARRQSHRRPIVNEDKSARGRDESEQGAWEDWTAGGGSVKQHDGENWDSGPQTATAVTGVEGNGVQIGDKINETMESREGVGEGGGDLYSRAKRRGRAIPDLAG